LTVIATNTLGDGLNDVMNPRTRRARMPNLSKLVGVAARTAPTLNQARTS
jgi:hypothetical protein